MATKKPAGFMKNIENIGKKISQEKKDTAKKDMRTKELEVKRKTRK